MTRASPDPFPPGTGPPPGAPLVLFVATEDWFFASHFLPMARATRAAGHRVAVAARERAHRGAIEAAGARLVPVEAERRSLHPLAVLGALRRLRAVVREERPAVVHLVALRAILLGGLAARLEGRRFAGGRARLVVAPTGLGLLGARRDAAARLALRALGLAVRAIARGTPARFLFENPRDPLALGLRPGDPRVVVVGGAGIDPDALPPAPLPPATPLRAALVARMLWSKGPDLAVEAVARARAAGADVALTLVGAPDPSNPRAVPEASLRAWAAREGVTWAGRTEDVAAVWREHHVALAPSRGGEGLPRALLEAAASGRAILTTDVAGCGDFVRDGVEGLVVPPGDAGALAAALVRLAGDPALVARMGVAARARALDGHTEAAVGARATALHAELLRA